MHMMKWQPGDPPLLLRVFNMSLACHFFKQAATHASQQAIQQASDKYWCETIRCPLTFKFPLGVLQAGSKDQQKDLSSVLVRGFRFNDVA